MKFLRLLLLAGLVSGAAHAADREFADVVRAISDQLGVNPLHVPFLGFANAFVAVARPAGAKHVDIAIFENAGDRSRGSSIEMVRGAVGAAWRPFVQVKSNHGGREESVLVYVREQDHDWKLLVTSLERDQAVVVQIRLNPEGLQRWLASPQDSARHWNSASEDR